MQHGMSAHSAPACSAMAAAVVFASVHACSATTHARGPSRARSWQRRIFQRCSRSRPVLQGTNRRRDKRIYPGRGPIGGRTRGYARGGDQSEEGQDDMPGA
eukprot:132482-Pyramimonas_sp.AAC.1